VVPWDDQGVSEHGLADVLAWATDRTQAHARGRVLDVGCGDCRFLPADGVGVDVEVAALRRCPAGSRLVLADAHALPFAAGSFDTALAHRMLNQAGAIDALLRELRRVLAPGGRLLVFTRARPQPGDRLDRWNGQDRLERHFASVQMETYGGDERAAFFIAQADASGN
jgi:ubiquinone/menaquinone biosynthesis C-methylase UbiE